MIAKTRYKSSPKRVICIGITRVMRITLTAALKTLLSLIQLEIFFEAEAIHQNLVWAELIKPLN